MSRPLRFTGSSAPTARAHLFPSPYGVIMVLTIIFMPFGLSGAIRRYGHRWFGVGVEPIIPRRLGH